MEQILLSPFGLSSSPRRTPVFLHESGGPKIGCFVSGSSVFTEDDESQDAGLDDMKRIRELTTISKVVTLDEIKFQGSRSHMIFRQLFECDSFTYTYIIASDVGREAVIIDPVLEKVPSYLQLMVELDLRLLHVIDTHVHADHITGAAKLLEAGNVDYLMGEHSKVELVTHKVKEGENIDIDGLRLTALYTPGHTRDSYSFLMSDRVFTGDTLMIRSTGRTDFQNGDSHQQYESLFNKLLKLPDHLMVYPAHDYCGMTVSTIGEEKRYNPRLQVSNAEEYAEVMANLNLAIPRKIDSAVPANLKGGTI